MPPVAALGAEWQIPGIGAPTGRRARGCAERRRDGVAPSGGAASATCSPSRSANLTDLQESAASASQSLANGTATDVSSVVTAVEKAQLAMQLAGQIRTKGSEAINDIFHTQI